MYPDQVVDDGVGFAVPIDLARDPGSAMQTATHHHLHETLNAIRSAILEAHRGASV